MSDSSLGQSEHPATARQIAAGQARVGRVDSTLDGAMYEMPSQLGPTSLWDGLNIYQREVARDIHRAAPEIPVSVIRAAVGWIQRGELNRHYGVAYSVAYSLRAALREGVLEARDA